MEIRSPRFPPWPRVGRLYLSRMLSTFIAFGQAPMEARPQTVSAPATPTLTNFIEPYDQRIRDYLAERLGFAIKSWTMLNAITAGEKPRSEVERRRIMRKLLERHKLLLHEGAIRRSGRFHVYLPVAGQPPPLNPFMRNIPRRRRRVRRRQVLSKRGVSMATAQLTTPASASPSQASEFSKSASAQSFTADLPTPTVTVESSKTKSAAAPGLEVGNELTSERPELYGAGLAARVKQRIASIQAGSKLARRRWNEPKIWTGYVHGKRCWRGQRVLMSYGAEGELQLARRGVVYVFADERPSITSSRFLKMHEQHVALLKLPEAVLLGARKRGRREQPSERKAAACKANGARPVRPGSRPRGRPRST